MTRPKTKSTSGPTPTEEKRRARGQLQVKVRITEAYLEQLRARVDLGDAPSATVLRVALERFEPPENRRKSGRPKKSS